MNKDNHGDLEIIHDTHQGMLAKKDPLASPEKPLSMQQIEDFATKHQGRKSRKFKMEYKKPIVVDLVVFNILEGLPVPSVGIPSLILY